ncbi:MAG: hypothetical protein HY561_01495 [Gemmatimonadetes bacterium]|nr:hypothetical protein [Gemmatimonadota bacterium]
MPETTSGPNTFPGEAAGTRAAPRSAKGFFASIGAVGAAFFASLCCVGPLLFVTFGVGAGLAATFEPLRPLFTVVAAGLLALGFYVVYGRKSGAACTAEPGSTRRRVLPGSAVHAAPLFRPYTT